MCTIEKYQSGSVSIYSPVRLSLDQSRYRSPLEYDEPRSLVNLYQEPRSRFVDLRQPFRQPTIHLRDKLASQCSSSRTRAPFPTSRRDLDPQFQGVKNHSQVSTPCVTAKLPTNPNQPTSVRNPSQEEEKPVSPSPKVNVLEAHISSSSSSRPSSKDEKEKDQLDDQLQDTPPILPKKRISKYKGKETSRVFHRKKIVSRQYRKQKFKNNESLLLNILFIILD